MTMLKFTRARNHEYQRDGDIKAPAAEALNRILKFNSDDPYDYPDFSRADAGVKEALELVITGKEGDEKGELKAKAAARGEKEKAKREALERAVGPVRAAEIKKALAAKRAAEAAEEEKGLEARQTIEEEKKIIMAKRAVEAEKKDTEATRAIEAEEKSVEAKKAAEASRAVEAAKAVAERAGVAKVVMEGKTSGGRGNGVMERAAMEGKVCWRGAATETIDLTEDKTVKTVITLDD